MLYAAVTGKRYKPPIKITEYLVGDIPEYIPNDKDEMPRIHEVLDDESLEKAQSSMEDLQKKIGLKPISNEIIQSEADKITNNPNTPKTMTKPQIMSVATKNIVMNFMKHCLNMNKKEHNLPTN